MTHKKCFHSLSRSECDKEWKFKESMLLLKNNGSLPYRFDIKLHTKNESHTNTRHHCQRKKKHKVKNCINCGCEKTTIRIIVFCLFT